MVGSSAGSLRSRQAVRGGTGQCDLLAEMRKLYPAVRAAAVTGHDQDRQRCAEAGFDRFLVKPEASEALVAVV